jgi:hypothetical protein
LTELTKFLLDLAILKEIGFTQTEIVGSSIPSAIAAWPVSFSVHSRLSTRRRLRASSGDDWVGSAAELRG